MRFTRKRSYPLHFKTNDPQLDRLLKPNTAYRSPFDVVSDAKLSFMEKKAILASWASDACAVESQPGFRQPADLLHPVSFDDIMTAMQALDRSQTGVASIRDRRDRDEGSSPLC
jgi:hypothetical protein